MERVKPGLHVLLAHRGEEVSGFEAGLEDVLVSRRREPPPPRPMSMLF